MLLKRMKFCFVWSCEYVHTRLHIVHPSIWLVFMGLCAMWSPTSFLVNSSPLPGASDRSKALCLLLQNCYLGLNMVSRTSFAFNHCTIWTPNFQKGKESWENLYTSINCHLIYQFCQMSDAISFGNVQVKLYILTHLHTSCLHNILCSTYVCSIVQLGCWLQKVSACNIASVFRSL